MSSGNSIKTRSRRVASLTVGRGTFLRTLGYLRRGDVLLRLGLCLVGAIIMWACTAGWDPPFAFRKGYIPFRDVVARVDFQEEDAKGTDDARIDARSKIICLYAHDARPLVELRQALKDSVFQVSRAESFDQLDKSVWREFFPADEKADAPQDSPELEEQYNVFRTAMAADPELVEFEKAVERSLRDLERDGLLESLEHELTDGVQTEIDVHPAGNEELTHRVTVEDVRLGEVEPRLRQRLTDELRSKESADRVFYWLLARLPTTLKYNQPASRKRRDDSAQLVEPMMIVYEKGSKIPYVEGGEPLSSDGLKMLALEHDAFVTSLSSYESIVHSMANLGMYVAMYVLCGVYIYYRERRLLSEVRRFITMLALFVVTISLCRFLSRNEWPWSIEWQAELVPLVMFGIIVTIAYRQEVSLLLTSVAALVVVLSLGQGLDRLVVYVATSAAVIELSGHIRSRTKLITVGMSAGLVAFLTTFGVGLMTGFPLAAVLFWNAIWYAFCAVLAALLMTGILPFIESLFDVQTELSLLEMGDAAHPLLQELVQRAPGTYNHSINVASIAEAAAEAIGANGLLVRVGAYFHDIGKMLKPGYFVENQAQDDNRHESLVPAMSTLVIIAHVKDGADLARQHRLPNSMIDFIEQHHGTTLVEYFYDRAKKGQHKDSPDNGKVDENTFRSPGPKPQTREAGVMMLADSVESACRTLVEPTPARIESLVEEIAMKRLLDGEFDESGLTLSELRIIEVSLVKSLTAVYHGRVKYPSQHLTA